MILQIWLCYTPHSAVARVAVGGRFPTEAVELSARAEYHHYTPCGSCYLV